MHQISLLNRYFCSDWKKEDYFAQDFFQLTDCNFAFFDQVIYDHSHSVNMIVGPRHSGKSHLINIWKNEKNAVVINKNDVDYRKKIEDNSNFVIDDVQQWIINDQEKLFNIFNIINFEYKRSLLLASSTYASQLNIGMRDLLSRLLIVPVLSIPDPDEKLMQKILQKRFNDVQFKINQQTIIYIVNRIPRTFEAIENIFQKTVRFSLEHNVAITIVAMRRILMDIK